MPPQLGAQDPGLIRDYAQTCPERSVQDENPSQRLHQQLGLGGRCPTPGAGLGCSLMPKGLPPHLPQGSCPAPDLGICYRWVWFFTSPKGSQEKVHCQKQWDATSRWHGSEASVLRDRDGPRARSEVASSQAVQPACGWPRLIRHKRQPHRTEVSPRN